jgi:hypothetical protein
MTRVTTVDGEIMLQLMVLTIDGKRYACLGPVLHVPTAGIEVGDVEEIEFGELIPAESAARLLCGQWVQEEKIN